MFDSTQIADSRTPPNALNMTTKAELLRRGKAAIDAGESSLREAAEALALAQQDFKATQREIAEAVGRSLGWVNRLLKWRRSGYKDSSPFGPTTKVGRVQHAEQRTKTTKPRKPKACPTTASPGAKTSPIADTERSGSKRPSPQEAKGNLKYAVDHWWPHLDDAGKVEITAYFLKKTGARVS
jgi:Homeodomain-like domain